MDDETAALIEEVDQLKAKRTRRRMCFDYWFFFANLGSLILIGVGVGFVGATLSHDFCKRKQSKSIAEHDIAPSSDENAAAIEFKEELTDGRESKEEDAIYVQVINITGSTRL
eukprot:453078_1